MKRLLLASVMGGVMSVTLGACEDDRQDTAGNEASSMEEADMAMQTTDETGRDNGADDAVSAYETVGSIEIYDDRALALIPENAGIEKLTGDDFSWSEGPVWISEGDYLLFSDVPENVIYKWSEQGGLETFLQPSGYDGPQTDIFRESGTNGLIRDDEPGFILMGDHGNRSITRLNLETKEKTSVVAYYDDKKFSSPNDLVLASSGAIYFTDPPYGLQGGDDSPAKEQEINGVYVFAAAPETGDAYVAVVDGTLSRPNGVILSPDEQTLYVAQSDPAAAKIFSYTLGADGLPTGRSDFADMTTMVEQGLPGLPDGMAMDAGGNLYATGPGGVHVFAPDGTRLALISTGTAAANVTFGGDGSTLYITSGSFLARVELLSTGVSF
ncbi:SMP-30/gluconolactonase/LRE family protein [Aquisalinus flavus]|nr:SMP-30/gluconolactonase/LRE family protein [Aquisalinus flavus]